MDSGQPGSKHRAGPLNYVSNKTNFNEKWATQATQRATFRIELHIPLINLNKKDQNVLKRSNLAQLTRMQPKGIYKGYKVAKKVLIGTQY